MQENETISELIIIYIPMVPFRLDEWANPKGDIHFVLLNQPNELHHIGVALEIELQNQNKI